MSRRSCSVTLFDQTRLLGPPALEHTAIGSPDVEAVAAGHSEVADPINASG